MNREDVRLICDATLLPHDEAAFESLSAIGDMMDEVVRSELCEKNGREISRGEARLRSDEVRCDFSREEMLAGVQKRSGDFAVVPRVIRG